MKINCRLFSLIPLTDICAGEPKSSPGKLQYYKQIVQHYVNYIYKGIGEATAVRRLFFDIVPRQILQLSFCHKSTD